MNVASWIDELSRCNMTDNLEFRVMSSNGKSESATTMSFLGESPPKIIVSSVRTDSLFDTRPLNRQVLEASGLETHGSSRTVFYWKSDFLMFVESLDKTGFMLQGRGDIVLGTIGDFRRFCSLPGIEIEVVVPEDYKP